MNRDHLLYAAAAVAVALALLAPFITAPSQGESLPMVYIIYEYGKGDLSYTDSAYRGLFAAQEALPFVKREFVSTEPTTITTLQNITGPERPGLVITIGDNFSDTTRQLAGENPDVFFLAIDQAGIGSENIQAYEITAYGGSYLAGVLAASATRTKKVGILLGMRSELLDAFHAGYRDGARAVDPSVTLVVTYVNETSTQGFTDPVRGAELAGSMYRDGTDIIYTVAGFSGTGAITEARRSPGRYIIGVDADQTHLGPTVVLASAVKRVDRAVYSGIGTYLNGTFTGGNTVAGLSGGMTTLSFNPKFAAYAETVGSHEEEARAGELQYLASRKNRGQ